MVKASSHKTLAWQTAPSLWGRVVACQANYYWVKISSLEKQPTQAITGLTESRKAQLVDDLKFLCTRRARLKKLGQQVLVGDQVQIEEVDWQDMRGAIATVLPRQTELDRPPVANVDHILLVFALSEPTLDPHQLSRFLVKAESTGIDVSLCLNKQDLISETTRADWTARLHQWGYDPIMVSFLDAAPLSQPLIAQLQGRTTVVAGPSGVGKSSLINRLIPNQTIRTGRVSGRLGRGRHTTRHVELFELPMGGFLADTPGFNQPDITCTLQTLNHCFPEIRQRLTYHTCQFNDCLHRDEPGCAIRESDTPWERYEDYLGLLEEVLQHQQALDRQRDTESIEKVKVGNAGKIEHEPKLEAKKYRRTSRRSRQQNLQDMRVERLTVAELENLDDADLADFEL